MRFLNIKMILSVFVCLFALSGSLANAGSYSSSLSASPLYSSSVGSYSAFRMNSYNYRSHNSLHRVNYKRHFTLHRVYDKDRRSYRALRKLKKRH